MKTIIENTKELSSKASISSKKRSESVFFTLFFLLYSLFSFSQLQDSIKVNSLDEVLVTAVRVTTKTPISFSNLSKKDLQFRNLGQDIPVLMNYLPSVVTTSDAGNGFGYTGIRVRGSDATRVNVTINGIPYNDAESQGLFWVNMPDFASSVESLQLQRGVGTSTNGASAFGASLNILTDNYKATANGEISSSFGSFGSQKHTVKFSTGLLDNHFELAGRLSTLKSDGYIDRASSDLKSYFLQGTYVGKTTLIKALVFGGIEKTYQSWNGIDAEALEKNRTFNFAGIYTDEAGNTRFYHNEIDNYQQDHYQLHWSDSFSNNWRSSLAFHYTKGKGYFENYKEDAEKSDYNLLSVGSPSITDLVRQKWLDNDFYGTTFSLKYETEKLDLIFGGGWNKYAGDHFGKVIWTKDPSLSELGGHYYDDYSIKTDGNIFAKANYQFTKKINFYADLQYRKVTYKANGRETGLVNDTFHFLNPKAGLNYEFNNKNTLYFSYARANREPNRSDYEGGSVKPEKLNDLELGWRFNSAKFQLNSNLYYMRYKDQLILTGKLDDVGSPIRANTEKSYRLGFEIDATIKLSEKFLLKPNFSFSSNKNVDLEVEKKHYEKTEIAYSPNVIAGNILVYSPMQNLHVSLLQKYVGKQYMNNIEFPAAKLTDYFVNDLNISYTIKPKLIFTSIIIMSLINNVLDTKYVSNGTIWDIYPSYYPQAGINFLAGLTLKF